MQEIFKDIPGYEGLYQVSNLGNVKSLERQILCRGKYPTIIKEKLLKSGKDKDGYLMTNLCKNGKMKTHRIHKLVMMSFENYEPNLNKKIIIDHIDNNPSNNFLSNLQLISHRENSSKDKKNGSSQYIGVSWQKDNNKWKAEIYINGKSKYLGLFSDELDAHKAYQNTLKQLNG
jgi:hypothetical protein